MQLYLISGDGNAAGKTTLARRLVGERNVWSLARPIRNELATIHPAYDWHSKDPEYKNTTRIKEARGATMREVMVAWGEGKCSEDPFHYVKILCDALHRLDRTIVGPHTVAVDDVRKRVELEFMKLRHPSAVHIHVISPTANPEPEYGNDWLRDAADYVITWRKGDG